MISSLILALFNIFSTTFTSIFTILTVKQYTEVIETHTVLILILEFAKLNLVTFKYSTGSRF